jgi:hypothetical protein
MLAKVAVAAVRVRTLSNLVNVDRELAARVAQVLGIPVPPASARVGDKRYPPSPKLSMIARGNPTGIASRQVAFLAADGVDIASLQAMKAALVKAGAGVKVLSTRLGTLAGASGGSVPVDHLIVTMPSVVFDAMCIFGGTASVAQLKGQWRCCAFRARGVQARQAAGRRGRSQRFPDGGRRAVGRRLAGRRFDRERPARSHDPLHRRHGRAPPVGSHGPERDGGMTRTSHKTPMRSPSPANTDDSSAAPQPVVEKGRPVPEPRMPWWTEWLHRGSPMNATSRPTAARASRPNACAWQRAMWRMAMSMCSEGRLRSATTAT